MMSAVGFESLRLTSKKGEFMRLRVLVPIFAIAFSVSTGNAQIFPSPEESLNRAVMDRMNYLEKLHGIKFERGAYCGARLGIPKEDNQSLMAEYVPDDGAIYMNPRFTLQLTRVAFYLGERAFLGSPKLSKSPFFVVLLDHELGHVLADHISRRIGNGVWPNHAELWISSWDTICGTRIVAEGIAGFFGYSTTEYKREKAEKSLPVESDVEYWRSDESTESFYAGGYWLVEPILRNFGEKGIEYLVTHPFDFADGRARQAAKEYQKKALVELGKLNKKK